MADKALVIGGVASKAVSTSVVVTVGYYEQMRSLSDPFIWLVMVLGGILSIMGVLVDYYHLEKKYTLKILIIELIKGLIAGMLVSVLVFIGLMENGNVILHKINSSLEIKNAIVWFMFAMMMSIGAVRILDIILDLPSFLKSIIALKDFLKGGKNG